MSSSWGFKVLEWWAGLGRFGRVIAALFLLGLAGVAWLISPESWLWVFGVCLGVILLILGISHD